MSRFIPRAPVGSAPVARARLQSLLEHDRSLVSHADLLSVLREEIFALIGRHAVIDTNKVQFMVVRGNTASTLTVDIEVPFRVRTTGTRYAHDGDGNNVFLYR
jgi:cell division topological specificity factor